MDYLIINFLQLVHRRIQDMYVESVIIEPGMAISDLGPAYQPGRAISDLGPTYQPGRAISDLGPAYQTFDPVKPVKTLIDVRTLVNDDHNLTRVSGAAVNNNNASSVFLAYFTFMAWIGYKSETNSTKCFGHLGCLDITEKWYGFARPVNLLPLDRHIINTQFFFRKRGNFQDVKLSTLEPRTMNQLDQDKPIKMIIHGFIDTGFENWVKEMSDALLEADDVNVIVVDWGGGSLPMYSQAAANTRLVGMEIAHILNTLISSYGFQAANIHIIGHSLGAHIAGYAGEKIPGLGRISGLDPAEPLFQDMPNFVRLDPTDADFVDVIHTDANTILMGGYGMYQSCGHVDFYPNGGKVQPGCSLLELPDVTSLSMDDLSSSADSVGRHLVACAHNRAISLYIDSIVSIRSCPLIGHKCESYEKFESGSCYQCGYGGTNCAVMGYGADTFKKIAKRTTNNKMFLDTGSTPPFCKFHYMLKIHLAKPREAEKWVKGFIKVNLYGDEGELTDFDLTPDLTKLTHGSSYQFLVTSPTPIGYLSTASLHWECSGNYFYCKAPLYVSSLTMVPVMGNLGVEEVSLCGEEASSLGYSDVTSSQWKLFYKECRPNTVTLEIY